MPCGTACGCLAGETWAGGRRTSSRPGWGTMLGSAPNTSPPAPAPWLPIPIPLPPARTPRPLPLSAPCGPLRSGFHPVLETHPDFSSNPARWLAPARRPGNLRCQALVVLTWTHRQNAERPRCGAGRFSQAFRAFGPEKLPPRRSLAALEFPILLLVEELGLGEGRLEVIKPGRVGVVAGEGSLSRGCVPG